MRVQPKAHNTIATEFRAAVAAFADSLRANFALRQSTHPEYPLQGPVQVLLRATRAEVTNKTEVHVDELGARPDIGVEVDGHLSGQVELKASGVGALARKFKGRDKTQWHGARQRQSPETCRKWP